MSRIIPSDTIKTSISLPESTFRRAESLRRKRGKSRSGLYAEALEALLRNEVVRELEEKYAEGYRRVPENISEITALAKAASASLPPEDW